MEEAGKDGGISGGLGRRVGVGEIVGRETCANVMYRSFTRSTTSGARTVSRCLVRMEGGDVAMYTCKAEERKRGRGCDIESEAWSWSRY
jgi:hypothetical protein